MVKSSPAWHRNARAARARARRAARRGHITESKRLRILDHHLARMIRTLAKCGAEIALFGKGQTAPNANARLRSLAWRWILGSDVR